MRKDKTSYYWREILSILLEEKEVANQSLADQLGISEKACRTKVASLAQYLEQQGWGQIEKKPRVGIWLNANTQQRQAILAYVANKQTNPLFNDHEDRLNAALEGLFHLHARESLSTQRLADQLYVSLPTALKVMKDAENWLTNHQIELINERGRGYRLHYEEHHYRLALKAYLIEFKKSIADFFYPLDVQLVSKSIVDVEKAWHYEFTDESFLEIWIYCILAIYRKETKLSMTIPPEELYTLEHYTEYPFTVAIFQKLSDHFHYLFSNEEIYFLTTQIMCSKMISLQTNEQMWQVVQRYDQTILHFVEEMLTLIGKVLDMDLLGDQKLKESLVLHLRPTIFRLRYGTSQENSMIGFIKHEYKTVFRATWAVSILFEKYFKVQITEDEIGFIVLYIQSAIERKNKRYKALLITNFTRGYTELVKERIQRNIPEIALIEVVGRHDFHIERHPEVDLIITSQQLDIQDQRIVLVGNLLSDEGLLKLRQLMDSRHLTVELSQPFSTICYPLFSVETMLVKAKVDSKKAILERLSSTLEKQGYVTKGFVHTVLEREQLTSTSVGNGVALPHGMQSEVLVNHVAVALLAKPVEWEQGEWVDIVFLLAIKMQTHEQIQRVQTFYKEYISLIESERQLEELRKMNTSFDLFTYLIR